MRFIRLLLFISILVFKPEISLCAGRVIWDQSHTPLDGYDLDGNYRNLSQLLSDTGYTVVALTSDLVETGLWSADIFVVSALSNFDAAYSDEEIEVVEQFVEAGGGLIVLSDNGAARPRNLSDLTARFGILSSRDDRLGNLTRFEGDDRFAGFDDVHLQSGASLELHEDEGASAFAFDENDLIGMAGVRRGAGEAIVIGDANLWTNEVLTEADNAPLALVLFEALNREALGRVAFADSGRVLYLPVEEEYSFGIEIENSGDGALAWQATAPEDTPISIPARRGILAAGESARIAVELQTEGLEPDSVFEFEIAIDHNDPTQERFRFHLELHTLDINPTHFRHPAPTGIDHSLLISEITLSGDPSPEGVEIGIMTPGNYCAGAGRYLGDPLGIAVRGDDPATEEVDGFRRDEPFSFLLYIPWEDLELSAIPEFVEGDVRFTTDGFSLISLEGRSGIELTFALRERWSLVSLNLVPASLSPREILAPLVEADRLMMVKDGMGHFWDVERGFSNLGEWNLGGGYQIKVRQPSEMTIFGPAIDTSTPIVLRRGWNSVAYFSLTDMPLDEALTSIEENLEVVKRGDGAFWLRRYDWDGIGALQPGYGYLMRLTEADELVYPDDDGRLASAPVMTDNVSSLSDRSMSLLAIGLPPFSEIAASIDEVTVAVAMADKTGRAGLAIWGDDPSTPDREGCLEGEIINLQLNGLQIVPKWLVGDGSIDFDEVSVAEFKGEVPMPTRSPLFDLSPNPFNDRAMLTVSNVSHQVGIEIYDVLGRLVFINSYAPPSGTDRLLIELPAGELPSGILIFRLEFNGRSMTRKALHLP